MSSASFLQLFRWALEPGRKVQVQRRRPAQTDHFSLRSFVPNLEVLEDRLAPAVFMVLNTNDSGADSLRQAILDANANPDADEIRFQIGAGLQTISPLSALPAITNPVQIDGTAPVAFPTQRIELNGTNAVGANGLVLQASNSILRGLVINRFDGSGILITGSAATGNLIEGNFIGTDATGHYDLGNIGNGVLITGGASNNTIGGSTVEARNFICGNDGDGIRIQDSSTTANRVQGNYIGLNPSSIGFGRSLDNGAFGVRIYQADGNFIGTDGDGVNDAGEGNIITANIAGSVGIQSDVVGSPAANNVVAGNYIGVHPSGSATTDNGGTIAIDGAYAQFNRIGSNADGISDDLERNLIGGVVVFRSGAHDNLLAGNYLGIGANGTIGLGVGGNAVVIDSAPNNTIGGTTSAARNVIAGYESYGILIMGTASVGNLIQGNYIGLNAFGGGAGNGLGILVWRGASNNTIGGTTAGARNVISYIVHGNSAIVISDSGTTGNAILGNSISANAGLGIDLAGDGVTVNDLGDLDTGANNLQNFPVLTEIHTGATTHLIGTVNSLANATFRLEFFANADPDPSGYGEGQRYLGYTTVITDPSGNAAFDVVVASATTTDETVSATATLMVDDDGDPATPLVPRDTSEFAPGVSANQPPTAQANGPYTVAGGDSIVLSSADSTDPDGSIVTYEWDFNYDGVTFDVDAIGAAPTFSAVGIDGPSSRTIALRVTDNGGAQQIDTATVEITNAVPTALNDSATTNEDQAVAIPVLANDSDAEGVLDPLRIDSVSNGARGVTLIDTRDTADTTDDAIIYTPNAGATGDDTFTYSISDGDGGIATGTVTVHIQNLVDLSGRVFDDQNNDGLHEPGDGEVGIGGVTVQLFNETSGALIDTQTTAADGTYAFDVNLGAGTYRVIAAQPAGFLDGRETPGNLGGTVDNTQDSKLIGGITVGDPGTTADAVDYLFANIRPSQALGLVWKDSNNDGQVDFGEAAIAGVAIELTGLDERGNSVNRSVTTDAAGIYAFINLRPSNAAGYTVRELQPAGYVDGLDSLGTVNGVTVGNGSVNDLFSALVLPFPGSLVENYNFGERPSSEGDVISGQTATIGFWQNKQGQKLINSLNDGSTATQLGNWLAVTFPALYGADAGVNNLTGKTNAQVAAFYKTLFARTARTAVGGGLPKMDAQVMATALGVYVTTQSLAGTTASAYGFLVTANGLGARTFNVGSNGAAFGVANNSSVMVLDLLLSVNSRSGNGLLYDLDGDGDANDSLETSYRNMANNLFSAINEAGDI
jgi:Bacterial Ig domain/SdrD B-like domain